MKRQDVLWVDLVRIMATFFVVLLHSAAPLLYKYNELSITNWWAGNIYDSMVRMCVPLFFMLSGYLLLDKNENVATFFKKRISKVVVPLIAWSIIYILWKHYFEGSTSLSFYSFYSLALTPTYFHLWFLYAIIGLYLFIPILRVLIQNANKELQYYFVILWFVAVSIVPFMEKVTRIDSIVDLKMISGYVGYLALGYLLGNIKTKRKIFIVSANVFILTIIITSVGTYILTSKNEGVFVGYLYSYLSPNIIFMSISFFMLIKYVSENFKLLQTESLRKIITIFSSASLGIYFIHAMVLYSLKKGDLGFSLSAFSYNAIYSVPVTAIATYVISFLVVFFIQRIPIVQKIVP